ncbi:MAG: hypothetical protein P8X51_08970 [Maritimibacter sp.]
MKIAFEEGIWNRLYGPYGNRSVNTQLRTLSEKWDNVVAKELFWEELHHQDDIYPATFASLPWLVELSPSKGEAFEATHLFLTHVNHHHSWIPQSEWLTVKDQPILIGLEQWFSENWPMIANRCLNLVGSDLVVSAYAVEGFASANGSSRVAWSIQMFADGEDVEFISRELGAYDDRDAIVVAKLFPHLHERNPDLASFLLDYPGCNFVPDDPRQRNLV